MDKFLSKVRETIRTYRMLAPGEPVLAALSGGADSVALVLALQALGYPVRACHLNHGLRGAEADRDEAFCRDFCQARGVPLTTRRVDAAAYARESGESIEAAARRLRYGFFAETACGDKTATAHNANDNLETMLFHLARGTGPKGLAGIPPARAGIVRPLIACTRAEIEAFLRAQGQAFVTDSTNLSADYTRNRIRHGVVPALLEVNARAAENAGALSARLRQDEAYLEEQARALLERASGPDGVRAAALRDAPPALRTRALRLLCARSGMPLRDLSARHIAALEALLESESPSAHADLPAGFAAQREYALLRLGRETPPAAFPRPDIPAPGCGTFGEAGFRVSIRRLEKVQVFYNSFNTFHVDCDTIDMPTCVLRTRRAGDRLRLTERGGSKTLKKLLIEKKIPSARRGSLAVLADKNGLIAVQSLGIDVSRRPKGGAIFEIRFEG